MKALIIHSCALQGSRGHQKLPALVIFTKNTNTAASGAFVVSPAWYLHGNEIGDDASGCKIGLNKPESKGGVAEPG